MEHEAGRKCPNSLMFSQNLTNKTGPVVWNLYRQKIIIYLNTEDFFMKVTNLTSCLKKTLLFGFLMFTSMVTQAKDLSLYTPNTRISAPPGASIDYTIDIINESSVVRNENLSVTGLPSTWTYTLQSGSYHIDRIAVLPGEKKSLKLKVEVPFQVNKGIQTFYVNAINTTSLPLSINVTEKGAAESELSTTQNNMQGDNSATLTYKATLRNRTAEKQHYSLRGDVPRGWNLTFKADFKAVTSVELEPNSTKELTIELKPSATTAPGVYTIPVKALTGATAAALDLEAVVTGSYAGQLTTPDGRVSTSARAGREKELDLVLRNTGTSTLHNLELRSNLPANWELRFEPEQQDSLQAGETAHVKAYLKPHKNAIPGDYVTSLELRNPEINTKVSYRVTIKTPALWGWLGVLLILGALGGLVLMFRKYGRR